MKLKAVESAMWGERASLELSSQPSVIKISAQEALSFDRFRTPARQIESAYAAHPRLTLDEFYDGYVLVLYDDHNAVVRMRGRLSRVPTSKADTLASSALQTACLNGRLFECVSDYNGTPIDGLWSRVREIEPDKLTKWIAVLQMSERLEDSTKPQTLAQTVRDKVIISLLSHGAVEFTSAEYLVVSTFDLAGCAKLFAGDNVL